MTSLIVKAGIAALIAFTGLSATAPTAAAASPEFRIHVEQVQFRDRDRRRPGCAPWQAERRASRMGLRRPRVVDVSRRTVTVVGFGRRGPDRVIFANARGCPLIRR